MGVGELQYRRNGGVASLLWGVGDSLIWEN